MLSIIKVKLSWQGRHNDLNVFSLACLRGRSYDTFIQAVTCFVCGVTHDTDITFTHSDITSRTYSHAGRSLRWFHRDLAVFCCQIGDVGQTMPDMFASEMPLCGIYFGRTYMGGLEVHIPVSKFAFRRVLTLTPRDTLANMKNSMLVPGVSDDVCQRFFAGMFDLQEVYEDSRLRDIVQYLNVEPLDACKSISAYVADTAVSGIVNGDSCVIVCTHTVASVPATVYEYHVFDWIVQPEVGDLVLRSYVVTGSEEHEGLSVAGTESRASSDVVTGSEEHEGLSVAGGTESRASSDVVTGSEEHEGLSVAGTESRASSH
jgi:hypothetical protein